VESEGSSPRRWTRDDYDACKAERSAGAEGPCGFDTRRLHDFERIGTYHVSNRKFEIAKSPFFNDLATWYYIHIGELVSLA
jgi:hypothetical protein